MSMTRDSYARILLTGLGYPVKTHNLHALITLMQSEGGDALFNPLNTTKKMPGSTDFNSVHVQNYTSIDQGFEAVISTLREKHHRYGPIRRRLRTNWFAASTIRAWGASEWGTEITLALAVLEDVKNGWYPSYASKTVAGT